MSGKIEVNYDLPPSSQTLAGMYCTQECTGMYCTQARDGFFHHSKLEQSSSSSFNGSNGRWSVLLLENNNGDHLILRLTSLAKLKKICMQFARKMHPRISDAKLGNNLNMCIRFLFHNMTFFSQSFPASLYQILKYLHPNT